MFSNSLIYEVYQKVNLCRNPKDNKFLDVAILNYANCLIVGDDDLLSLEYIVLLYGKRNIVDGSDE
jgi:uncharacterized protein